MPSSSKAPPWAPRAALLLPNCPPSGPSQVALPCLSASLAPAPNRPSPFPLHSAPRLLPSLPSTPRPRRCATSATVSKPPPAGQSPVPPRVSPAALTRSRSRGRNCAASERPAWTQQQPPSRQPRPPSPHPPSPSHGELDDGARSKNTKSQTGSTSPPSPPPTTTTSRRDLASRERNLPLGPSQAARVLEPPPAPRACIRPACLPACIEPYLADGLTGVGRARACIQSKPPSAQLLGRDACRTTTSTHCQHTQPFLVDGPGTMR